MRYSPKALAALLIGSAALAFLLVHPPSEKSAIVGSTLALIAFLIGVHYFGGSSIEPKSDGRGNLIVVLALGLGILVNFLPGIILPVVSVVPLAIAVVLLFLLSKFENDSNVYVPLVATFLAAMIAYNVFLYYPLDIGVDSWGHLAVSSHITQTGYIPTANLEINAYYGMLPVVSVICAVLASVSGLNLLTSLFVFPGILIVMQPLLVFLVTRSFFGKNAANLSAIIVVCEAAVIRWINAPIAESVAISLSLLFLFVLARRPNVSNMVTASVLFVTLAACHGGIALISIALAWFLIFRKHRVGGGILQLIIVVFLAYLVISPGINKVLVLLQSFANVAQISTALKTAPQLYRSLSSGLPLIWYGWPAALALVLFLVRRHPRTEWIYGGLGLLGVSFAVNIVAPLLDIDRYGGFFAWCILAVVGGEALHVLTKSSRQTLIVLPILLLVCTSAIVDPTLSPQYGISSSDVMPTSISDRAALNWLNANAPHIVVSDPYSLSYLLFLQYESTFSAQGDYLITYINGVPQLESGGIVYVRSQEIYLPYGACQGVTSSMIDFQKGADILFNDGCGVAEASASVLTRAPF